MKADEERSGEGVRMAAKISQSDAFSLCLVFFLCMCLSYVGIRGVKGASFACSEFHCCLPP